MQRSGSKSLHRTFAGVFTIGLLLADSLARAQYAPPYPPPPPLPAPPALQRLDAMIHLGADEAAAQRHVVSIHHVPRTPLDQTALQADVAYVVLPARVGTAVEIDADRLIDRNGLLQVLHDLPRDRVLLIVGQRSAHSAYAR